MNWLTKYFTNSEKRSGTSPTNLKSPATWLMEFFGHQAGEIHVNNETAMQHSAVWACVRVIAETIASLPFQVYERKSNGHRIPATDHPLNQLISNSPNINYTSFTFRETLQTKLCLQGNAYALISRDGGNRVTGFTILDNTDVNIKEYNGEIIYQVNKVGVVPKENIIHIPALAYDGIEGWAPLAAARKNIQLGLASQQFGYDFFKNGANLNGYLTVPEVLDDEGYERMRKSWQASYTGHGKSSQTAILEQGTKYERIGIPPEDAQFLETRKFQVNEIARIFRVPPHMIGDLEKATFSNIEHQSIDFVTHTIRPWVIRWEQEFNRKIFRIDESGRFYVKFNLNALLRGDASARAEYYNKLFQIGAMSQNDIRSLEDLNPVEGGDRYYVPLNMAPVDKLDEILTQTKTNPTDGTEE